MLIYQGKILYERHVCYYHECGDLALDRYRQINEFLAFLVKAISDSPRLPRSTRGHTRTSRDIYTCTRDLHMQYGLWEL